ncbi:MAG TPA: hypothetical protein VFH06_02450 [Candidatus Saccharimonadales bacterium]|nr:hypothetical protein [Candidatus Saccharimonadales bacterium]
MSKLEVGILALFIAWMVSAPGFAIFLGILALLALIGQLIGENSATLLIYIILTMAASYIFPIVMAVLHRQLRWLLIVPLVTSILFAFPSSLVALAGCRAGNGTAIWAMRAIPALQIGEIFAPKGQGMTCVDF